jgi:hypothetical protein
VDHVVADDQGDSQPRLLDRDPLQTVDLAEVVDRQDGPHPTRLDSSLHGRQPLVSDLHHLAHLLRQRHPPEQIVHARINFRVGPAEAQNIVFHNTPIPILSLEF